MTESIFKLRCVDCDAQGLVSRLWIRKSLILGSPGRATSSTSSAADLSLDEDQLHYVECMNCSAHLKNGHRDRMESVDDEEWRRFVEEGARHVPAVTLADSPRG